MKNHATFIFPSKEFTPFPSVNLTSPLLSFLKKVPSTTSLAHNPGLWGRGREHTHNLHHPLYHSGSRKYVRAGNGWRLQMLFSRLNINSQLQQVYVYWVHMSLVLSTINCRMGWESLGITLYVWSTDRLWEKGESLSLAVIPVSTARLQQTTPNTWLHRRPG